MKTVLFFILIGFTFSLFLGCSDNRVSGASVNTGNTISGVIVDESGKGSEGASVQLLTSDHNPVTDDLVKSWSTTTDRKGRFTISQLDSSVFNLEAKSADGTALLLKRGVEIFEEEVTVPDLKLQSPGRIIVNMPDYLYTATGDVYIPGTSLLSSMKSDPIVDFLSVPVLKSVQIIFSNDQGGTLTTLAENVDVDVDGRVEVSRFNLWAYQTRIEISTTAAGIALNQDILGFPFLIRLNGENFSFEQAREDGSDLRFTKADGVTPLPYQIERWNSALSVAEVWVRVDTVFADSSSQTVLMYSGNNDAHSLSSGTDVFNSTNGFRSVWHLGENTTSSTVEDAAGSFDGNLKSADAGIYTESVSNPNVIGHGFEFEDWKNETWIDLGGDKGFVNSLSEITVSLWMNSYTDTVWGTSLVDFSINGPLSDEPESRVALDLVYDSLGFYCRAVDTLPNKGITAHPGLSLSQWLYITGVIKLESGKMELYLNGDLLKELSTSFKQKKISSTNSAHGAIGSNDNGTEDYFSGLLDEVRLEVRARSPEWIKLCYENQKMDENLITVQAKQ